MISDKVKEILSTLIESTKNGDLIWHAQSKGNSGYNNERDLSATSEDGLTKFNTSVKYTLNGDKWCLESSPGLWIKNKDLPGEGMYITSYNNPDIIILRNLLNTVFCSDMKPSSIIVEDKLTDICKSISKSTYRDNILKGIFNGKK